MQALPPMQRALRLTIPDGRSGVAVTLAVMRHIIRSGGGRASLPVRQLALQIVADLAPKDRIGEARALHEFVRDRIRYVRDIRGVETVQTPERTLANGQGDCDDKTTLLASLLEAIGHRTRLEAVGFSPGRLSHVLPSADLAGHWVPLETTLHVGIGWYPPGVRDVLTLEV